MNKQRKKEGRIPDYSIQKINRHVYVHKNDGKMKIKPFHKENMYLKAMVSSIVDRK